MPSTADMPALRAVGGTNKQLSEAVADAITNAIAQGAIQPGERLVEEMIAAQLSVSRVPLREAIRTLEAQGIVVVTLNRGARVVAMDESTIAHVQEARIALETVAARGAIRAIRREPRLLEPMQDAVDMMRTAKRRLDWTALRRCDVQFHRELCLASGNDVILKLWEALSRHITIIFGREIEQEHNFDVVIAEHERLMDLLAQGSPTIEKDMEEHILRLGMGSGRFRGAD